MFFILPGKAGQVREDVSDLVRAISSDRDGNIQKIVAAQIEIQAHYYNAVLRQGSVSFCWSVISMLLALAVFITSLVFQFAGQPREIVIASQVAGVILGTIAGIHLSHYSKTTAQLNHFHQRLDQLQRFLLANNICEAMEGEERQRTRRELIAQIVKLDT
jgi:hypothetical protein